MLGMLDVRGVQENSRDVGGLRAHLQQIVGEPFLCARFSYGEELTLHFGAPRTARAKKLAHLVQGSYILGARASSWYFKCADGAAVIASTNGPQVNPAPGFVSLHPQQVEAHGLTTPGARVIAANVAAVPTAAAGFPCSLLLSDGSSLLILPETDAELDDQRDAREVADWELFMAPHSRYLRVGSGPKWSYLPSSGGWGESLAR